MDAYHSIGKTDSNNQLSYDVESRINREKSIRFKEKKISDSQNNIFQLMMIFIGDLNLIPSTPPRPRVMLSDI